MADQIKVILWACPRTVSSAFLKCMDKVPESKMVFEMFSTAQYFGPDRVVPVNTKERLTPLPGLITDKTQQEILKDPGCGFDSSICTYKWLKHHMETGYPDKKVVIFKEICYSAEGKFEYLPDSGCRHAFLIRNPIKVLHSWMQQAITVADNFSDRYGSIQIDDTMFFPHEEVFKAMYDLYSYVKEKGLDPDPVILDADDLVNDPATILSGFCKSLGIPYSDELLSWDAGVDVVKDWSISQPLYDIIKHDPSFENFRNSTCFFKPNVKSHMPRSEAEWSADLREYVQRHTDSAMPYYKEMHKKRMN
ncbi:uncharacterized protein [Asterias amurensis]|uniref:uncharacterized protein n=1 Tax=Asterias amurensis TaxID=7602 RepID=UPI003AB6E82B